MPEEISYDAFVGFKYNNKHSSELKIYRTSNGDRYEINLIPSLTEKTAAVDGMVGQYYFGTQIGTRVFNVSFAFDAVTKTELNLIKKTFCGDGLHDLIFDEEPDKVYSAKVTGTAMLKTLCFGPGNATSDEDVYKGEGSIQFTCYYPYAHSSDIYTGGVNNGDLPAPFTLNVNAGTTNFESGTWKISITTESAGKWDSKTGLVIDSDKKIVSSSGDLVTAIPVGATAPTGAQFYKWYY